MDIVSLLTNASGGDLQKRQQAQAVLEEAEKNQTDQYMVALCNVVGNAQANAQVREIAALQIKTLLTHGQTVAKM